MKKALIWLLIPLLLLGGCDTVETSDGSEKAVIPASPQLEADEQSFGSELEELGVYEGYFEGDSQEITVTTQSGTKDPYTLSGNTLTFTAIDQDTVCSISGTFRGNIVIDVGDDYKFDLEMTGFSLVCDSVNPITVSSGSEVSLTAKKDTQNYIYDMRTTIEDEALYAAAIYSLVDLEICGKGSLTLLSENNNGIHTKDDLQVKNLTLLVACVDNALKGNDSVELENATTTLIASGGDGIKTSNTNISDKGNQRGTVTVTGGCHTIYAACDGIDAAYDVVVDDSTTQLSIYTDKYSNYSQEVTATAEDVNYIRFNVHGYQFAVKYYNADTDYTWVIPEQHSTVSGGRSSYYYYSYPKMPQYHKVQFFIYDMNQAPGQETDYLVASDYLTQNESYDTFALEAMGNQIGYSWTNYTTNITESFGGMGGRGPGGMGGFGGMNEGNSDKGSYSTKGIKAGNEICIINGTVTVKSYDDALHANCDSTLENGATPLGNVTLSGGTLTLYSNDDGIHADGIASITGGTVYVIHSYEGLEGNTVSVTGGAVSLVSSDDGINATATTGQAITLSGGTVYVYAGGDGIDANSRSQYEGIVFAGADVVVISTGNGNSSIDTEQGYTYQDGRVIAIMPNGGMTQEATHCQNYTSIATGANMNLSEGDYLTVTVGGKNIAAVQMPARISGLVIYLGSNDAKITAESDPFAETDQNNICWNK